MAACTTGITLPGVLEEAGQNVRKTPAARRRRISLEARCALDMLGHAMQYLVDAYMLEGRPANAEDPRIKAVLLLMAASQDIYFACPEVPTLRQRCFSWFRQQSV